MKKLSSLFLICVFMIGGIVIPHNTFAMEKLFYFYNNVYGLTNYKKNYKYIDTIAPQIYTVDYDLSIKKPKDTKIIKEAKKKKSKIVPLLVNADFSKILMSDILLNQKAQDNIIDFMITEAQKNRFSGWQFDFENINHLDRAMYADFVAKTYTIMKKNNLEFSVAVIPRNKPYDVLSKDQDWSSGYDFSRIATNSDFVSLMSYDDPYSLGPVASIPFTQNILTYMKTQIPASKISLGIPLYCWKWDNSINARVGSLTHKLTDKEYRKGDDATSGYNNRVGSGWMTYVLNNTQYTTWCESEESMRAKLDMIESNGLRGFSAWALGQEPTWLWRTIKNY